MFGTRLQRAQLCELTCSALRALLPTGKFSIAYLERGGEKEYFLASCFGEVYIPPSANLSLRCPRVVWGWGCKV